MPVNFRAIKIMYHITKEVTALNLHNEATLEN
jgi:hypothetical protein